MAVRLMKTFHGYSIEELTDLLSSRLDIDGKIQLDQNLLEGWSSLNILGYINQEPAFVLKLPKSSDIQDFHSLATIHEVLSKKNLCPNSLYHGPLSENDDLPILILEHVDGHIYNSPFEITEHDYWLLKDTLENLASISLPGIPIYADAIEHLNAITRPLELRIYDYGRNLTSGLHTMFEEFISLSDLSHNRLEASDWFPVTIHGDLYERNIIFREDSVILLDMEECCVSDRFYDSVYLFAQSYTEKILAEESPFRGGCPKEHWMNLEILALCSVIKWSLQRLLDLEFGLVEINLSQMVSTDLVREYVREKMEVLTSLLSQ